MGEKSSFLPHFRIFLINYIKKYTEVQYLECNMLKNTIATDD